MNETYLKIFDQARPFLDTRDNKEHTRIACEFAARLLQEAGGDAKVVMPAIILHDVGWMCIPEDLQLTAFGPGEKDVDLNRIHELEGARIAVEILEIINYPECLIGEITAIISGHDSRQEAISLNDAIVKDSDKLWRYSFHGVTVNARRFNLTVSQYLDRLRTKMEYWFLTPTGRRIAREELGLRERSLDLIGHGTAQSG